MSITSVNFDGDVRIIASSIVVPVVLNLEIDGVSYSFSAQAVAQSGSEEHLDEAFYKAKEKAESLAADVVEKAKLGAKVTTQVFKDLSEIKSQDMVQELKAADKYTTEAIATLNGPPKQPDQDKIDKLCEVLGIPRIQATTENGFTFLYARALIKELERKAAMFEVDMDKSVYRK